jgi:hypothetical protein
MIPDCIWSCHMALLNVKQQSRTALLRAQHAGMLLLRVLVLSSDHLLACMWLFDSYNAP